MSSDEMRYPLGLPPGSVRSILALMVVGMVCTLCLISTEEDPQRIPPYLVYLLLIMLGSFFAVASGTTNVTENKQRGALGLPRGVIHGILFIGLVATIAYKVIQEPDAWKAQFELSINALKSEPFLPLYVIGGFFVGVLLRTIMGRDNQSFVYRNFLPWISILAVVGLTASLLIELVINPNLHIENKLEIPEWDAVLAAIVAFYFGARS